MITRNFKKKKLFITSPRVLFHNKVSQSKAECLFTLQEGFGAVNSISATNSGLYLASAGHDGQVYFWNLQTGSLIDTYEGPGRIMETNFNHTDSKFVLTSYGTVIILELSFNKKPSDWQV